MLTGLKLQRFFSRHVIFVCGHDEIWNSDLKGDVRFPLKEGFMQAIETQIFSVTHADYVIYN